MKADQILQADLLDIIFDNRNKQYGAYELRSEYGRRLYRSISIIFIFISGLLVFSLLYKPASITGVIEIEDYVVQPGLIPPDPQTPVEPQVKHQPTQRNSTSGIPVLSDSSDRIIDSLPETHGQISFISGSGTVTGPFTTGDTIAAIPGPTVVFTPVERNRDEPLVHVDVMPEFPGGLKQLRKFLEKNLREPDQLQQPLQEGQVISVKVTFIVGYDGKLKGFGVTEDGGEVFNNEVIRVLKKMPDWTPGIAKGENVSVYYTIPVKFTAQ